MAADDLSAPLGRKTATKRWSPPIAPVTAVAYALTLLVAVFLGWALIVRDPLGGEPAASVAVGGNPKSAEVPVAAAVGKTAPRPDALAKAGGTAPDKGDGSAVITIIDGSTGQRQEVKIATGDQRLFESTRHGNIPKIASDGTRPADAYARPRAENANSSSPHIAIVVGGLGVGTKLTAEAIAKLPGPITLGFSPYGAEVGQMAAQARGSGHELLLQVPMEPLDFPDSDPGPQALLTSLSPEQNIDRLHWLMSRFPGYVGLMNFMGARFEATESAFVPILKEAARRGLIYFDDGASARSIAAQAAGSNNAAFAKADVVIDAVPTAGEIDKALSKLETTARANGSAVGFASALPISVEQLAKWAKNVESRGFVLVPISVAATKTKSS